MHDNMVTENLIQALSSTNMELLEYISYARSLRKSGRRKHAVERLTTDVAASDVTANSK